MGIVNQTIHKCQMLILQLELVLYLNLEVFGLAMKIKKVLNEGLKDVHLEVFFADLVKHFREENETQNC